MRKVILAILMLAVATAQAQTWNEWFRQKKTQIQYLERQIVALQMYIELGQKGYSIARDGLQLIHDIRNGDFDLHNNYFNSLLQVKPAIATSGMAVEVILVYASIQQELQACKRLLRVDGWNSADIHYLNSVLDKVVVQADENLASLNELATNGHYAFTDDERLHRMILINDDIKKQYSFTKHLYSSIISLKAGRIDEHNDVKALQKIYNLPIP